MGVPARTRAVTVWVIAALLIGFAPLFHAICIAPIAAIASGEGMVHTMADGTVMSSASFVTDEQSTDAAGAPHAAEATIDPDGLSDLSATLVGPTSAVLPSIGDVGMILVVVGLAVLTMIVLARWRELARSFRHPPLIAALARARPIVAAWPRAAVDLDALGISRT
jgi:hypothetical protein